MDILVVVGGIELGVRMVNARSSRVLNAQINTIRNVWNVKTITKLIVTAARAYSEISD